MKWINKHKSNGGEWNQITVTKTGLQINSELSNTYSLFNYRYVHIAEDYNDGDAIYYLFFTNKPLNVSTPFMVTRFNKSLAVRIGATSLAKCLRAKHLVRPLRMTCVKTSAIEVSRSDTDDIIAIKMFMEDTCNGAI